VEITEVTTQEYRDCIKSPYHLFASSEFNDLNKGKADDIHYLLFRDDKIRLGIILGRQDKTLKSPFSAPFGGFSFVSENVKIQYLEKSISLLSEWASSKCIESIELTLPPLFYNRNFIAKQINCLWRMGYELSVIDLNYSYDIKEIGDFIHDKMWRNARKNLRISMEAGLNLLMATDEQHMRIAYDIIAQNRSHRGFPLRMTLGEVLETSKLIPSDFFIVENGSKIPIASAIVFHVSGRIPRVIYWGDLFGYSEVKPINFLSFKLYEYYKMLGKEYIDIGHSTEGSVPNYGLCEFKESIGCSIYPRYTFKRLQSGCL